LHVGRQLQPRLVHRLQRSRAESQVFPVGLGTREEDGDHVVVDGQDSVDGRGSSNPDRISLLELRSSAAAADAQRSKGTKYVPP
jgi:hypothetical protein